MRWCLLACALAFTQGVHAAEEIQEFSSRIQVCANGDLIVAETIRVTPEGDQIKRGIFRDFPTIYSASSGLRTVVPFEVLDITRDGKAEAWHSESRGNGVRIYIGDPAVFLPHVGTTYVLRYRVGGQLGFFKDFDELYWNVTGNGWAFPILKASACVELPTGVGVREVTAYTGPTGSKAGGYVVSARPGCAVFLSTTGPLWPGEGLTISVTWPKGFVKEPALKDRVSGMILSNAGATLGVLGLLIVAGYYLLVWSLVGRDPKHGVIVPRFEPPTGFTPQDVRYLNGLGTCDNTSFACAVLQLAVLRALEIRGDRSGGYSLAKVSPPPLDPEQTALREALFKDGSPIPLHNRNAETFQAAQKVLAAGVGKKIGPLFARNTSVWVVGLLATLVPLGISLLDAREMSQALGMLLWLSIWSLGCGALSVAVVQAWRSKSKLGAIPMTLFSIPFFGGWFFGMWMLSQALSLWVCALYVVGIAMCAVFQHLLKRPTLDGQKRRDEILGFKKYLSVAEADRLELENPPERTPELFERFLPYALALGVENEWSEQFSDVLTAASQSAERLSPTLPGALAANPSSFTGSFASAISSASTSPGSSSGSGGGGSSGGGGGGGGGGGW